METRSGGSRAPILVAALGVVALVAMIAGWERNFRVVKERPRPPQDRSRVGQAAPDTGAGAVGSMAATSPSNENLPKFGEYVHVEELPEAITKVPPVYPDAARSAMVEGTVMVQALIGRDGKVKETRVVKSIPLLDASAVAAVRQWVFKPAMANKRPVAVWVAIPVKYSLH